MRVLFSVLMLGLSMTMSGCESTRAHQTAGTANDPIMQDHAALSAFRQQISHILHLVETRDLAGASAKLQQTKDKPTASDDIVLLAYTKARLLAAQGNPEDAYLAVSTPPLTEHIKRSTPQIQAGVALLTAELQEQNGFYLQSADTRIGLTRRLPSANTTFTVDENHAAIWSSINKASLNAIQTALLDTSNPELTPWLQLNAIIRDSSQSLDKKASALEQWDSNNPGHPAQTLNLPELVQLKEITARQKQKIAVILPFSGKYTAIAEAIRDGIMYHYYQSAQMAEIRFYSAAETDDFLQIYDQAVTNGANLVIGPLFKNQLEQLYRRTSLPVTTLALNKLELAGKPAQLYELSLAPEDEIHSLVAHATNDHLQSAFLLAQDDEFSQKNMSLLAQEWKQAGKSVIASHRFTSTAELSSELEKPLNLDKSRERIETLQILLGVTLEATPKSRTDIDTVIIFAKPDNAGPINHWLNFYFADGIAKYANSSIYRGYPDSSRDKELDGIRFTDIPLATSNRSSLPEKYRQSSLVRMYAFGLDALQAGLMVQSGTDPIMFAGATGQLFLENGDFIRSIPLSVFSAGKLQALPVVANE